MKPKYIDEAYPQYFIFGIHTDGKVDLSTADGDICTVTREEADKIIQDRGAMQDLLFLINELYPEEFRVCFNKLQYGV